MGNWSGKCPEPVVYEATLGTVTKEPNAKGKITGNFQEQNLM